MCGIVGLLQREKSGLRETESILLKMSNTLAHRGPDGYGSWAQGAVGFGHRRLSIQDLSNAGKQPMSCRNNRFTMVFNGEIYNHFDLRNDLIKVGVAVPWRGHSDTETLLECISVWGLDETLKRCKGMFAVALWDQSSMSLSLARDRIGEKPLYYGWAGSTFVFGSELKALVAHPEFSKSIDRTAVAQFMRFAYIPAPLSIWQGVYKLEPGTVLEIKDSHPARPPAQPVRSGQGYESLHIRSYWSLAEQAEKGARNTITNDAEAVDSLESTLKQAIQRQLISDVPLGAFLSGGVDSSTIVALMQESSTTRVKTFTICFESAAFDEAPYARRIAQHLGTDHHEFIVTDNDARAVIHKLPYLYDEPFADSSQIPTHLVSQHARTHVIVALSGDAGDELFGGYNRYLWSKKLWNYFERIPFSMRKILGRSIRSVPVSSWDKVGTVLNQLRQGTAGVAFLGDKAHRLAGCLSDVQNLDELYFSLASQKPDPRPIFKEGFISVLPPAFDYPTAQLGPDSDIARMMYRDMMSYLPDDILCKVDRAAMGVSLETRVPFLDPDVIDVATRMTIETKIRGSVGKWPIRQILYKRVPQEMIDRPKAGFAIPVGEWLRGPLRTWAEDTLWSSSKPLSDWFDAEAIRKTWEDHVSGQRDSTSFLWSVLMFQQWREVWT